METQMNSEYRHIPNCYTKSIRTYTKPRVVTELNFDGWLNCDNCGRDMDKMQDVYTHWLTVRKTYMAFEEVTDFVAYKQSDFTNDYDDFVYVTCSMKCSYKKRNGEK